MTNPSPSWNTVVLYGTWLDFTGGHKKGSYKVTCPVRVTNATDDVIFPAGEIASGELSLVAGTRSLEVLVPATDDPDNSISGYSLTIDISFLTGQAEQYVIQVPLSAAPGGIDLSQVVLPQTLPPPLPILIKSIPNGIAALDGDGDVINAAGAKIIGGGSSSTGDAEFVRDTIATALLGSGVVSVVNNDVGNQITISSIATVNDTDVNLKNRVNHTGTQTASTISDFAEVARDTIGTALVAGANMTITVNDAGDIITLATTGGGTGAVTSVAGKTGVVTLVPSDAGAAASVHTHAITDITNLTSTLAAKAALAHSHVASEISNATATGQALMTAASAAAALTTIGAVTIGTTSTTAAAGNHTHSTYTTVSDVNAQIAAAGVTLTTKDVVYSSGTYPAQAGSPPGGVVVRHFYGPTPYIGASWTGVLDLYTYANLT